MVYVKMMNRFFVVVFFLFCFFNNIYLVATLLMTILTLTWRENKNNVQERKKKIQCYSIYN